MEEKFTNFGRVDHLRPIVQTESMNIVCQPIRSLQVGPDLPYKPHVSVNENDLNLKVVKHVSYKLSIWNYIFTLLQLGKNWLL